MKIQIGHSREYDFVQELYVPIKGATFFKRHTFYFPHHEVGSGHDSEKLLKEIDIFIAEVTYPSIGLGIELGLAKSFGKRIVCFYRKGKKISTSISYITHEIFEYEEGGSLIAGISQILK